MNNSLAMWKKNGNSLNNIALILVSLAIAGILSLIILIGHSTDIQQQILDIQDYYRNHDSIWRIMIEYFTHYETTPFLLLCLKLKSLIFGTHCFWWIMLRWLTFSLIVFVTLFCLSIYYNKIWATIGSIFCFTSIPIMKIVIDFSSAEFYLLLGISIFMLGFALLFNNKTIQARTEISGWCCVFIGSFIYLGSKSYSFLILPFFIFLAVTLYKHRGSNSDFGNCLAIIIIIFHLYTAFLTLSFANGFNFPFHILSNSIAQIIWESHLNNFIFCSATILLSLLTFFKQVIRKRSRKRLIAILIITMYLYIAVLIASVIGEHTIAERQFIVNLINLRILVLSFTHILWRDVCKSDSNIELIILLGMLSCACYNIFYF